MTIFDEATAVRRIADGVYQTHPDQRFALVAPGGAAPPAVNGGVLIATVLRAVLDCSPLPHPVATSAHFLRVAKLAPAQIHVTWLKTGRTAATARATLVQDGEAVLETTVTTGTVPIVAPASAVAGSGELNWTDSAPVLPAPDDCVELGPWRGTVAPDGTAGYAAQVRMLFDPAVIGWVHDEPSGLPEMRGYFGLREAREPDALLLALAVDGLPPVVFGLGATESRPGAGTSAAAGSTRRPRSGTRPGTWSRRAARSRGSAAARCAASPRSASDHGPGGTPALTWAALHRGEQSKARTNAWMDGRRPYSGGPSSRPRQHPRLPRISPRPGAVGDAASQVCAGRVQAAHRPRSHDMITRRGQLLVRIGSLAGHAGLGGHGEDVAGG